MSFFVAIVLFWNGEVKILHSNVPMEKYQCNIELFHQMKDQIHNIKHMECIPKEGKMT